MDRYIDLGLLVLLLFCVCVFIDLAYLKKKTACFLQNKTTGDTPMMMMMMMMFKNVKTFLLTHQFSFSCIKKKQNKKQQ